MSEDSDSKESRNTPPELTHIDLEQGEVLVRRRENRNKNRLA